MSRARAYRPPQAGFSLVELAVVTLIIGIFLTLGLGAINATRESSALSATNQKQAAIKDILIAYLRRNSRLPCPDDPASANFLNGVEKRATMTNPTTPVVTSACSATFGVLPYVTLGLARDAVQDGWGNLFTYRVSNTPTSTDWTLTANFRTGNAGVYSVSDRISGVATAITANAVAVVISHGSNGFGAYTIGGTRNTLPAVGTDELSNTDPTAGTVANPHFKRAPITDDTAPGGAFDDVVQFLGADDLLGPLFKDGTLRPPASTVTDTFQRMRLAVIGYAMSHPSANVTTSGVGATCTTAGGPPYCRTIPGPAADLAGVATTSVTNTFLPWSTLGLTSADAVDPWGAPYLYAVGDTSFLTPGFSASSPAASVNAVTLTNSQGGVLTISINELRGNFISGTSISQ